MVLFLFVHNLLAMKQLPATSSGGAITALSSGTSFIGSMYLYRTPGFNSTDKIYGNARTMILASRLNSIKCAHGENNFTQVSKNLVKYRK